MDETLDSAQGGVALRRFSCEVPLGTPRRRSLASYPRTRFERSWDVGVAC
jgi:hypothetical protein